MNEKLSYLLSSAGKTAARRGMACPSCGHARSRCVSRKYLVTTLRRCERCQLLFRAPTTDAATAADYYQDDYQEGFTTDLPTPEVLARYRQTMFAGSEKDFSERIAVVKAFGVPEGARICDFGCSWGYGSWQLAQHGFDVQAFELSRPRAAFAREQLGIDVVTDRQQLCGPFDVFFSSHVLEHVPSVAEVVAFAFEKLRIGGLFVCFTPNGSLAYRAANPRSWLSAWGLKHPNHLDEQFYGQVLAGRPYFMSSSPYDLSTMNEWAAEAGPMQRRQHLDGSELLVVARNAPVPAHRIVGASSGI